MDVLRRGSVRGTAWGGREEQLSNPPSHQEPTCQEQLSYLRFRRYVPCKEGEGVVAHVEFEVGDMFPEAVDVVCW